MPTSNREPTLAYHVKNTVASSIEDLGDTFLVFAYAVKAIVTGQVHYSDVLREIDKTGIGSLPIVAMSASFIGMAISVQFGREIVDVYGAQNMVGGFVSIAMFRELAPIFVSIVLAGNIGAAITAEIGTMKVTEQIDALKVFRIDPVAYLVAPRLLAICISGPILSVFGCTLSLLSGQIFTEMLLGIPEGVFWDSARFNTHSLEVISLLIKALVFSVTIVIIGSHNGLKTEGGSEAVGKQTTQTVVSCLLAIFILNYILTSLLFQ